MPRALTGGLSSLAGLVLALVAVLVFTVTTETGLQLAGKLALAVLDNGSRVEQLQGRLSGRLQVRGLTLVLGEQRIEVGDLGLQWSPLVLLTGRLQVDRFSAEKVLVHLTPGESGDDKQPPGLPDLRLPLTFTLGQGEVRDLRIQSAEQSPLVIDRLRLSAHSDTQKLHVRELQLVAPGLDTTVSGALGLDAGKDSDLSMQWSFKGDDALASDGQLRARGSAQSYRLEAQAGLAGDGIPAGQWSLHGYGNLQSLTADSLEGETLGGNIQGRAELEWSPRLHWQAELQLRQIDPGQHWPDWPGKLDARLHTNGGLQAQHLDLSLELASLQGSLRDYPVSGQADVQRKGDRLDIHQLVINSGGNRLQVHGSLEQQWNLQAQLDAPQLAALLPGWSGAVDIEARLQGDAAEPRLTADIDAQQLYTPTALSLQSLGGQIRLSQSDRQAQSIDLKAEKIQLGNQFFDTAQMELDGRWPAHRLELTAAGEANRMELRFAGGWENQLWQGRFERAVWEMPLTGLWVLRQPVNLSLGPRRLDLEDACLVQEQSRLCLQSRGDPQASLTAAARLEQLPLSLLEEMLDTPLQFSNRVDARLEARLAGGQLAGADLQARLGAGGISYDDPELPTESHLENGTLTARLDDSGVDARLDLDLAGKDYLRAALQLPGYRPQDDDWRRQTLAMDIRGDLRELLIVKYLLEDVGSFSGGLSVALQGQGTLGEPRLSGGASLADARLVIDSLGIEMHDIDMQLRSRDDGLMLQGRALSGDGRIDLEGELLFNDITRWEASVSLRGTDFEIMHQPEALILISPDLIASISPPDIRLQGELHVPRARLKPRGLETQAGRSSDVIVVDSEAAEAPDERWQIYSQVRLSLGDDVEIDGLGLKGDLLGAIELTDKPRQVTRGRGQLAIERGTYETFGRKLDIERGQLLFSGGPVDNPGLDFRASRKVRDVTAGVRVTGTLKAPELSLFSDPAMSESDIISYISFGRPMSQVGEGSGSAADSGLIAGGNLLGGMIGSSIGLEELGVDEGEEPDDAAMVLGTYLSPQLYVRYRTGLYEAINEFHVIYDFTRNWGIRTISSAEKSSAELRFSFER